MKYNFDEIIERRGTNSYKWDLVKEDGVIPMWVADMDFQTAPCVIEALQKRVAGSRVATSGTYRKTGFSTQRA